MKIAFWKREGILDIVPEKKYQAGYDLEISFCEDYVCFSIGKVNGTMRNVQISYEEFAKMLPLFNMQILEAMRV